MIKHDESRRNADPAANDNNNSDNNDTEDNDNEVRGCGEVRCRAVIVAAAVTSALTVIITAGAWRKVSDFVYDPLPDPEIQAAEILIRPSPEMILCPPDLTEPTEPPTEPPTDPPTEPPATKPSFPNLAHVDLVSAPELEQEARDIINKRTHQVIRTGAEDGVFDGALFVGDSRTVGFAEKSGVKATFFADVGVDVDRVLSQRFMIDGGEWKSLETLCGEGGYTKVYMSMGLNEMGWEVSESFISKYTVAASRVRSALPEAVIYIQGIIPITAEASATKYANWGGNVKLREYNDLLQRMCGECGLIYLDVYSAFADENGCLPEVYSSDGVHLSLAGYAHWREYLASVS